MALTAVERVYQPRGHRVLAADRGDAFEEGVPVRHVTAEFQPADDVVCDEPLECSGELVEVLWHRSLAGDHRREPVMIVVVLVAGAEGRGAIEGVTDIGGDSRPEHGLREDALTQIDPVAASVIAVDDE